MNRALPVTPQLIIYLNGHDYSPGPGAEFFTVIKSVSVPVVRKIQRK